MLCYWFKNTLKIFTTVSMETYHANARTCRMTNSRVSAKIFHCGTEINVNKKFK